MQWVEDGRNTGTENGGRMLDQLCLCSIPPTSMACPGAGVLAASDGVAAFARRRLGEEGSASSIRLCQGR